MQECLTWGASVTSTMQRKRFDKPAKTNLLKNMVRKLQQEGHFEFSEDIVTEE